MRGVFKVKNNSIQTRPEVQIQYGRGQVTDRCRGLQKGVSLRRCLNSPDSSSFFPSGPQTKSLCLNLIYNFFFFCSNPSYLLLLDKLSEIHFSRSSVLLNSVPSVALHYSLRFLSAHLNILSLASYYSIIDKVTISFMSFQASGPFILCFHHFVPRLLLFSFALDDLINNCIDYLKLGDMQ